MIPEAIQYFEVALEEKPDSIEAAHNCGLCLMQCRQFDASLEYFDKVSGELSVWTEQCYKCCVT